MNEEKGKWFVNGGQLRVSDISVIKEPEYKNKEDGFNIRKEYKTAYNVYLNNELPASRDTCSFLGVAFYNGEENKLIADKVFYRAGCER